MSNRKKVLICIAVFIACFILGIIVVLIINRVREQDGHEEVYVPTLEEAREAFLGLPRDERVELFLKAIWGDDFREGLTWGRPPKSPWPNITLEHSRIMTVDELEVVTYIILENEPYLGSAEEHVFIPIADDLYVDLKEMSHTYSYFSFQYPDGANGGRIKVTCRRDGVLLHYEYSFTE